MFSIRNLKNINLIKRVDKDQTQVTGKSVGCPVPP